MTEASPELVAVPVADLHGLIALAGQRWLRIDAAADYSGLSVESVRRLLAGGKLTPHRPLRGVVLIDRFELDSFIGGAVTSPRTGRGRS